MIDLRVVDPVREPATEIESTPPGPGTRSVLLVDIPDPASGVEQLLRTSLLGGYPEGTIVVVAARQPPSLSWWTDPVTGPLTVTMPLRGLSNAESCELLAKRGLPDAVCRQGATIASGHPLALWMLGDALVAGV